MSIWSLTYQQSISKLYRSDRHFSEFYLQDGGKNQLAYRYWTKWRHCHPWKSLSERDVVCTVQMANALSTFDNDGGGTTEADVNENDMPPPPPDADKLWWTVHTSPRLTDDSRFRPGSVHTNRVHGPRWNTCRRATLFLFTGLICGP